MHKKIFWLLLLFLPTQLGLHFWPDWTVVLGRRVDYLSPTIFFTDILIVGVLGSWIIETKKNVFPRCTLICIFLFLFVLANIFVAQNKAEAIYKWVKVFEFVGLGWYIVKTNVRMRHVIFPLSIGVLYSSVLAISQFIAQHSFSGALWWIGERTFAIDTPGIARVNWCSPISHVCRLLLRPYATFPHPNVLAGFLIAMIPILLTELIQKRNLRIFITLFILYIALALSFSRIGWIVGSLVTVITLASLKIKHVRAFSFILAIVLVVLLVISVKFNLVEESIVVREQLNGAAVRLWQQSPLFGVGLGNFLVDLPHFLVSRDVYFLQPVHNIYLLILSETGFIGIVLFVRLLWITLRKKNILSPVTMSLCALLTLGFFDHYLMTLQQGQILLTTLVSISMVQLRHD